MTNEDKNGEKISGMSIPTEEKTVPELPADNLADGNDSVPAPSTASVTEDSDGSCTGQGESHDLPVDREGNIAPSDESPDSVGTQAVPTVAAITAPVCADRLEGELTALRRELVAMGERLDRLHKMHERKDETINRQHQELEQFKRGLVDKFTLAVAQDFIALIDDTEKLHAHYSNEEFTQENYQKLLAMFGQFADDQRYALDKQGITHYRCDPESPFDPKRQRALKTVLTSDASLDKKVKGSLRWGFEIEGRVVRPEMVEVYVYRPQPAAT